LAKIGLLDVEIIGFKEIIKNLQINKQQQNIYPAGLLLAAAGRLNENSDN